MFFNKKAPWENRQSIYEYIKCNIENDGSLKSMKLPDDKPNNGKELIFAAGAMQGILGHHAGSNNEDGKEIANLIKEISINDRKNDKIEFYNKVLELQVNSVVDNIITELSNIKAPITVSLYKWLEFLVFESPDRNAVKIGIALLGALRNAEHLEKMKILGAHDEFTLFVTVAIMNSSKDYEKQLFDLAKTVHGWGRIEIVERLAGTNNEEIKKWILIEGYKNEVMYQYLALIAADTGELRKELIKDDVEDCVLLAASDIIKSLILEGPCTGISGYTDSQETIELFIKHTINKFEIDFLLTYSSILDFVSDEDFEYENGWTVENQKTVSDTLKKQIENTKWKDLILENLNNDVNFYNFEEGARILGLDIFDVQFEKLKKDPFNQSTWYSVTSNISEERADLILDFALKTIPLKEIATGADEMFGLGQEFKLHNILNCILQAIQEYPGKGEVFITTALKSPVVNNRNTAIRLIESWGIENLSPTLIEAINEAIKVEPKEAIKQRMEELSNR